MPMRLFSILFSLKPFQFLFWVFGTLGLTRDHFDFFLNFSRGSRQARWVFSVSRWGKSGFRVSYVSFRVFLALKLMKF